MTASSGKVGQAIDEIASISEENSAAVEEVSASAEEMNAQIEEVTASAQALAEMAEALQYLVVWFKLSKEDGQPSKPAAAVISAGQNVYLAHRSVAEPMAFAPANSNSKKR